MFRNWMNSLGVRPAVNHLYSDLCTGLVIFQLMDCIRPGLVDWDRRVVTCKKMSKISAKRFQQQLSNCNYAVELAKKLNLVSLPAIRHIPILKTVTGDCGYRRLRHSGGAANADAGGGVAADAGLHPRPPLPPQH